MRQIFISKTDIRSPIAKLNCVTVNGKCLFLICLLQIYTDQRNIICFLFSFNKVKNNSYVVLHHKLIMNYGEVKQII